MLFVVVLAFCFCFVRYSRFWLGILALECPGHVGARVAQKSRLCGGKGPQWGEGWLRGETWRPCPPLPCGIAPQVQVGVSDGSERRGPSLDAALDAMGLPLEVFQARLQALRLSRRSTRSAGLATAGAESASESD